MNQLRCKFRFSPLNLTQDFQTKFKTIAEQAFKIDTKLNKRTTKAFQIQELALFTNSEPIKAILAGYIQQKSLKLDNQKLLGNTLEYLGRITKQDLRDNQYFNILIKDILKHVYSHEVLAQIAKGMAGLNYHDDALLEALCDRAKQAIINKKRSIFEIPYMSELISVAEVPTQKEDEFAELTELLNLTQDQITQLVESINSIRNLYQNMLTIQNREFLKEQVVTNLDMLDFEESLLELNLLHPEELKGRSISNLDIAIDYIAQGDQNLQSFLQTVLQQKIDKQLKYQVFPIVVPQYGELMLSLAEVGNLGHERQLSKTFNSVLHVFVSVFDKLSQSEQQFDQLALAYAMMGLYGYAEQLIAKSENTLLRALAQIEVNQNPDLSLLNQLNLIELDNSTLVSVAIGYAMQGKIPDSVVFELKSRFDNIHSIDDIPLQVIERLSDLSVFLEDESIAPFQVNQQRSDFFKAIESIFPQQLIVSDLPPQQQPLFNNVYLVDSDNCSVNGKISGYTAFRIRQHNYKVLTVPQFMGATKEEFASLIKSILEGDKISVDFSTIEKTLSEMTVVDTQQQFIKSDLEYRIKQAKSLINTIINSPSKNQIAYAKQALQASLLEIQQRSSKINISFAFKPISIEKIEYPPWFDVIQSQGLIQVPESKEGFLASLIDQEFIFNDEYCPYSDWKEKLRQVGISGVIPRSSGYRKQIISTYPLGWQENKEMKSLFEFLAVDQKKHHLDVNDYFMINLLNFKQEMRVNTNLLQIAEQLLTLDLWNQLDQQGQEVYYLSRDAEAHLWAQVQKKKQSQQSVAYLEQRLEQNDAINQLITTRNNILNKLFEDVGQRTITKEEAQIVARKVNESLIEKIKDVKRELKAQHQSLHFEERNNFIQIDATQKDIDNLKIIREFDDLDIYDFENYIELKRSKAQEKMQLYRSLYLKEQKPSFSKYNHKLNVTKMTIGQLSAKDQAYFRSLIHSDLTQFQNHSVSDLILEISDIFDDQLYNEFLNKKFHLENHLQYVIKRRDARMLLKYHERNIFNSGFNDKQLEDLKQLYNVPSVITWINEAERSKAQNKINQDIDILNQSNNPFQNIYNYLSAKSYEGEVKVELLDLDHNIWKAIFQTEYKNTSAKLIHDIVELLVERFYLLSYGQPQFLRPLSVMILTHPNLHTLDRQVSYYNIKILSHYQIALNLPIEFNSADILKISQTQPEIPWFLQSACFPYGERLWQ